MAIEVIPSTVRFQHALVFLDDNFVFSWYPEQDIEHIPSVLQLLQTAEVTLKLKKCVFFSATID